MTQTIAKIMYKGTYRVIYDDSKRYMPYTVYKETYENGSKHKRRLISYSDFASCMYHITEDMVNP